MDDRNRNRRKGAVRLQNIYEFNGHEFVAAFFPTPTRCSLCEKFMQSWRKEGYQCRLCQCVLHAECYEKNPNKCTFTFNLDSENRIDLTEMKTRFRMELPHKFQEIRFLVPTFCHHCGQLILGPIRHGLKCTECSYIMHKKCLNKAPKNCAKKLLQMPPPIKKPSESHYEILEKYVSYTVRLEDFELVKSVGSGTYGTVFMVKPITNEHLLGIKAIGKEVILRDMEEIELYKVERDVAILGKQNPYLAKLFCTFQNESYLFFLMEFVSGGELLTHINESNGLTEARTRFYAAEILCGLQFLHNKNIVYRDLKAENVLIDVKGHCRIVDFGLCKILEVNNEKTQTFCGTLEYIAPEILKRKSYSFSVDFWSLGVLVYEMLNGETPFQGDDNEEIFNAIEHDIPYYPDHMSKHSIDFISALLEKDPVKRLGVASSSYGDIRKKPFFGPIDWVKIELKEEEPPFIEPSRGTYLIEDSNLLKARTRPLLPKLDEATIKILDNILDFEDFDYIDEDFQKIYESL